MIYYKQVINKSKKTPDNKKKKTGWEFCVNKVIEMAIKVNFPWTLGFVGDLLLLFFVCLCTCLKIKICWTFFRFSPTSK